MKKHIILLSLLTLISVKILAQTKVENLSPQQKEIYKIVDLILRIQHESIPVLSTEVEVNSSSQLKSMDYKILPMQRARPYSPWKRKLITPEKKLHITWNSNSKRILKMRDNLFFGDFIYDKQGQLIAINGLGINKNINGKVTQEFNYYDVSYNEEGKIYRIKGFLKIITKNKPQPNDTVNFQKTQKEYYYNDEGNLIEYKYWKKCNSNKNSILCRNETTTISYTGNTEIVEYIDHAYDKKHQYKYTYDEKGNLKQVEFKDLMNSKTWMDKIIVNDLGYVTDYIQYDNGKMKKDCLSFEYTYATDDKSHTYTMFTKRYNEKEECIYELNLKTRKYREKINGEWIEWKD